MRVARTYPISGNDDCVERGTVRYTGTVAETNGNWFGVEWDNGARGKHSGTHNGHTYFDTTVEGAGSFIRPNAVNLGNSFHDALQIKYAPTDSPVSSDDRDIVDETTTKYYATESNFEIQVVSSLKVNHNSIRLATLREIGLEGSDVAHAGTESQQIALGGLLKSKPNPWSIEVISLTQFSRYSDTQSLVDFDLHF